MKIELKNDVLAIYEQNVFGEDSHQKIVTFEVYPEFNLIEVREGIERRFSEKLNKNNVNSFIEKLVYLRDKLRD